MKEIDRQLIHLNIGLFSLMLLAVFGKIPCMLLLFIGVLAGSIVVHQKIRGKKVPVVDWFLNRFERKRVVVGYGSLLYLVGMLLLFSFLENPASIGASIIILAIGDGMATIVGREGRVKIPYNKKKTVEGSLAFLAFSLPVFFLSGVAGIAAVIAGAIIETLPTGVDDNITIPMACIAVLRLMG